MARLRGGPSSEVWTITTAGQQPPERQRPPRLTVGRAITTGLLVLLAYFVLSAVWHALLVTLVWLPAILVAGAVTVFTRRWQWPGGLRLILGVGVLVGVHQGLIAIGHALSL
jgi:hypothetical protein